MPRASLSSGKRQVVAARQHFAQVAAAVARDEAKIEAGLATSEKIRLTADILARYGYEQAVREVREAEEALIAWGQTRLAGQDPTVDQLLRDERWRSRVVLRRRIVDILLKLRADPR